MWYIYVATYVCMPQEPGCMYVCCMINPSDILNIVVLLMLQTINDVIVNVHSNYIRCTVRIR